MKNFALGLIIGMAFAVGGYKPYQIEMEYRRNIAAGLGTAASPGSLHQGRYRDASHPELH